MATYTPTVEIGLDRMREMARGNFDLAWMDSNPDGWGHEVERSKIGLKLTDVDHGFYGDVPERGSSHGTMAPRGCYVPEGTISLEQYTLNEMSEIWSDNAASLYDEAVVRQWNSVTDVPWHKLAPLPEDMGALVRAMQRREGRM